MEKIFKFVSTPQSKNESTDSAELVDQIRSHTVEDLESLSEDLNHLHVVVNSVKQNYQDILSENRELKALLKNFVEDCYCWEGNRCPRCLRILDILLSKPTEKTSQTIQDQTKNREKLRKLG